MLDSVNNMWLFLFLMPLVAFLYAAVGHGGASGYLALMTLFSFPVAAMKPTALLLNLFVAGTSFFHYRKRGHFNWKLFYPFALTSIPASFLGGYLSIDAVLYKKLLAIVLLFSIFKLIGFLGKGKEETVPLRLWQGLVVGGLIGLIAGMIGIGGGIILSPVILLFSWGGIKTTAAISALFIWVNSAAGMAGLMLSGVSLESEAFLLVVVALIGGMLGGYYGSGRFSSFILRYLLIAVLVSACIKLLLV